MIDCVVVFVIAGEERRLPGKINGHGGAFLDVSVDPTAVVVDYPPSQIVAVHVPDQSIPVTRLLGAQAGPTIRLIMTGGPSP